MGQTLINALLFIVLLGTLVTVHEAGHFLTAKAFGIKVLRFSIGFGPKILGFQWGETEYWISALPLGGYVKMAGDDPSEPLSEEDAGRGFLEQAPWKRALVGFAGPAMNLIFPVIVFFFAYSVTTKDYVPLLASVYPDQPAYAAGLRAGDRITALDGKPIRCFSELQEIVSSSPGKKMEVSFLRGGVPMSVSLTPASVQSKDFFGTKTRGMLGVGLSARSSVIAVDSGDSPAARAGLVTFDRITRVGDRIVKSYPELVEALSERLAAASSSCPSSGRNSAADASGNAPEAEKSCGIPIAYVRSWMPGGAAGALTVWKTFETTLYPAPAGTSAAGLRSGGVQDTRSPAEAALGIDSTEMILQSVIPDSPAWIGGLRPGDRIASIQGENVSSYLGFNRIRVNAGDARLKIGRVRDGILSEVIVDQKKELREDGYGNSHEILSFGAFGDFRSGSFSEIEKVPFKRTIPEAASRAVKMLPREIGRTVQSIWMLFFSPNISVRSVGGPIAIYHVTAQTSQAGAEVFLRFMGFISINLGLMNLLPIPILDGFHILSALVETIRRRPLGEKVQIALSYLGLLCLLALMVLAFRNDVLNFILR